MAEKKKIKIHSESEESRELDEAGDGSDAMQEPSSKTGNHDTGKEAADLVAALTEKLDAKEKELLTNQSVEILQCRYSRDFEVFDYPLEPSVQLLR